MKILHVNFSDNRGGASVAVMRLHKYLLDIGVDSNLLVSDKELDENKVISINKTSQKIFNIIKSTFSRNIRLIYNSPNKNTHSLNLIPSKLLKIINEFNADVVNLHWIGNETLSIKQISKIKSKVIWTMHDMWPFCGAEHYASDDRYKTGYLKNNRPKDEKGWDINRYVWNKKKYHFRKIEKIIVTSGWMKKCLHESLIFKDCHLKELPLLLDQKFWSPLNEIEISKKILNLPLEKKIITFGSDNYLGNERKGFNYIIEVLKKYKDNQEIEFVIFGEDNFNKLNNYLKKKINRNFINLGKIKDQTKMKLLYEASELIISPSIQEAFGLIISESQHMGVPCVIFQDTGSESIVEHKKTGFVAKLGSIEDFIKGIDWCLNNLNKRNSNIGNLIQNKFNSKKIANDYLEFLKI
jgi:glycosyltransferase involved in cell wall biosynthesis